MRCRLQFVGDIVGLGVGFFWSLTTWLERSCKMNNSESTIWTSWNACCGWKSRSGRKLLMKRRPFVMRKHAELMRNSKVSEPTDVGFVWFCLVFTNLHWYPFALIINHYIIIMIISYYLIHGYSWYNNPWQSHWNPHFVHVSRTAERWSWQEDSWLDAQQKATEDLLQTHGKLHGCRYHVWKNMKQDLVPMKMVMILIITLRLFNIAMETGPSIHVFLWFTY